MMTALIYGPLLVVIYCMYAQIHFREKKHCPALESNHNNMFKSLNPILTLSQV